jgi:hypothetical protein
MNSTKIYLILLAILLFMNIVSIITFNVIKFTVWTPQANIWGIPNMTPEDFPAGLMPQGNIKMSIPEIETMPGKKINDMMIALCVLFVLVIVYILVLLKFFPQYHEFVVMPVPVLLILFITVILSVAAIAYYAKIDYLVFKRYNSENSINVYAGDEKARAAVNQVLQYSTFSLNIIIGIFLLVGFYKIKKL